jgi:hypothetical protein
MLVNHALLKNRVGSASRKYVESYQITFSAFGRSTFHPRPCLPAGRHRTGFSSAAFNKYLSPFFLKCDIARPDPKIQLTHKINCLPWSDPRTASSNLLGF